MSLNSLFTGLSGIQAHQTRTNVVADNIANINTTGFKTRRANFEELLAQTIETATGPEGTTSGTNPVQAGAGVRLKSIDTNFGQGSIATTDRVTDLAIEGKAMFILRDASDNEFYTRDGSFSFDGEGRLVNPSNGMVVQGNVAIGGSFGTTATSNLQDVQIELEKEIPGSASSFVNLSGNLDPGETTSLTHETLFVDSATGLAAVAGTTINALTQVDLALTVGDQLAFSGTRADGTAFDGTFTFAAGDTVTTFLTEFGTAFSAGTGGVFAAALDATGKIQITDGTGNIRTGFTLDAQLIDSGSDSGLTPTSTNVQRVSTTVFDAEGGDHNMTVTFTKQSLPRTWLYEVLVDNRTPADGSRGRVTFNPDGSPAEFVPLSVNATGSILDAAGVALAIQPGSRGFDINSAATDRSAQVTISLPDGVGQLAFDLKGSPEGGITGLTQFASSSSVAVVRQNGRSAGNLETVFIGTDGVVEGRFSNGQTQELGKIVLASFPNEGGLSREGGNLFSETENTGTRVLKDLREESAAIQIISGALELSNVDMARELTDLIVTQRGFQANARVVTTTDQILAETVNLKQ